MTASRDCSLFAKTITSPYQNSACDANLREKSASNVVQHSVTRREDVDEAAESGSDRYASLMQASCSSTWHALSRTCCAPRQQLSSFPSAVITVFSSHQCAFYALSRFGQYHPAMQLAPSDDVGKASRPASFPGSTSTRKLATSRSLPDFFRTESTTLKQHLRRFPLNRLNVLEYGQLRSGVGTQITITWERSSLSAMASRAVCTTNSLSAISRRVMEMCILSKIMTPGQFFGLERSGARSIGWFRRGFSIVGDRKILSF